MPFGEAHENNMRQDVTHLLLRSVREKWRMNREMPWFVLSTNLQLLCPFLPNGQHLYHLHGKEGCYQPHAYQAELLSLFGHGDYAAGAADITAFVLFATASCAALRLLITTYSVPPPPHIVINDHQQRVWFRESPLLLVRLQCLFIICFLVD